MIYIDIETLIGNAFISSLEETGKRIIPYSKIYKFGNKIVQELKQNGKTAIQYFGRYETEEFFENYSEWFKTVNDRNGYTMIVLSENVTSDMLRERFSGYLSVDVEKVFRNPENVKVLLR